MDKMLTWLEILDYILEERNSLKEAKEFIKTLPQEIQESNLGQLILNGNENFEEQVKSMYFMERLESMEMEE
jgi:recombinational DNA repair protein RecR